MLQVKRVPLAALRPNANNPRLHPEANLAAIRASLKAFGQAEPIVVQRNTQQIIGGNGRLEAMRQLGWSDVEVVELDLSNEKARALGIALNRTAALAEWDNESLVLLLDEIAADELLDSTGFTPADIDQLIREINEAQPKKEIEDPGAGKVSIKSVSRTGDIWVLDRHLLGCGDATSQSVCQSVMKSEKAALVATDPPYLVEYTGERPNDSGKDWTDTYREIDIKDADGFFRATFTNILAVLAPEGAIYCWHAHKRSGLIQKVWEDLGIVDHQQIVWVKPTAVFGRVYWHFRHEPCVMGWRKGSQPPHDGQHEFNSVWEVDWEGQSRIVGNEHPTQKPVELFARPMRKHTKVGDIVFEPFCGSGSQIIAAERERRRCRAIELVPAYVDVAIERWQTATGKPALLDGDGRTFAEIAKERVP